MKNIRFDYSKAAQFINDARFQKVKDDAVAARDVLLSRTGAGNTHLGWIDLPVDYDKEEFARIQKAAEKIRSDSDILVVIGIGGSYLGARAAIEFLNHSFYNNLPKEKRNGPEIYYAGNSLSPTYLKDLLDLIGDRDSPSTSSPNPARPRSPRSPSGSSRNWRKRNTARKKPRSASTRPPTR